MNRRRYIIVSTQQPFKLDCRLNDPTVLIELYRGKETSEDILQKVDPQTDPHVTQNGQVFTIDVSTSIVGNHMDRFECKAINSDGGVVHQKTVILEKAKGWTLAVELLSFITDKANGHLMAT